MADQPGGDVEEADAQAFAAGATHLADALADRRHPAWLSLPEPHRTAGQDTLRILTAERGTPPRGTAEPT